MTERRSSPERRRPEGPGRKVRRVSKRKELAVVTLGMVAAISGVGGVLAANPPSWATIAKPATTAQQNERQTTERATAQRASRKVAGQKEAARQVAARTKSARKESGQAAQQQYASQAAAGQAAAAQTGQTVYSAPPQASASTAPASAVSQGS